MIFLLIFDCFFLYLLLLDYLFLYLFRVVLEFVAATLVEASTSYSLAPIVRMRLPTFSNPRFVKLTDLFRHCRFLEARIVC